MPHSTDKFLSLLSIGFWRLTRARFGRIGSTAVLWLAGGIGLTVITSACFRLALNSATTALVYLIFIVPLSLMDSFIASAVFSVMAVGCLDFFFIKPLYSFDVTDGQDLITLFAFLITSLAITGLVRRLRRLEDAHREQTRLLDITPDSILVRDLDGIITYWNCGSQEIYGWTREEAIGKDSHRLLQTIFPAPLEQITEILFSTGRWEGELLHSTRDGKQVSVASRWSLRSDGDGRPIGTLETNNDITKRKRAEDALRRAQETYLAEAQQLSHTGSFRWDVSSGEIFWSEETYRIYEYDTKATPSVRMCMQRVYPDDVLRLRQVVDRAMKDRKNFDIEFRLVMPNGSIKDVSVICHVIDDEGKIQLRGALMDVTARKRAEERTRLVEIELRATLDTIPVIVWTALPNGGNDFHNERLLAYTKLSPEQLQGDGWTAMFHPDDAPAHMAAWRAAATAGIPFEFESRLRRFDGEYRWFLARAVPLCDQAGNVIKWYGTNIDIEDRKQSERALQASEQRYRHLFHNMPVALWQLDERGLLGLFEELRRQRVTDFPRYLDQRPDFLRRAMEELIVEEVNHRTIQSFGGHDAREFAGSVARYWQESPDTFRRFLEARFRDDATFEEETKMVTLDGRVIDVLFSTARPGPGGDFGIGLAGCIDITDRVRALERLQQVQAEFAHAARISLLGELVASIAHEVNQPLASVATGGAAALRWLERSEPDVAKARGLVRRIVDDSHRAGDIITRIRAMAMGRASQQTKVSLNDVIKESMTLLRHECKSNGVNVSLDLEKQLGPVKGDRVQLQQVVVNLAMNAIHAVAHEALAQRELLIRTRLSESKNLCCTFEDSGPGIAPDHLEHLFASFFTTKDTGMGMGLSLARSIIEAHGGHIRVDNKSVLGGARFSFELPTDG